MHIGNGIICPVTGIPMIAAAGVAAFYAFKKAGKDFSKDKIWRATTLTGLVFALQTINFAIPTTGSSGHIIGGILLASMLGANVGFLAMCLILAVQALFFADGGLLALGCNIFNMGILSCFVAYPLFYKPLADKNKPVWGAIAASVVALQLGSMAVTAESFLSGSITASAVPAFTMLMQSIHLPIGLIEGLATGAIIAVSKVVDTKKMTLSFGAVALILAGIISKYASTKPDGLEWSLIKISDSVIMQTQSTLYGFAEALQHKIAIFSQMPFGNIAGLATVAVLMYAICLIAGEKAVAVKNEK